MREKHQGMKRTDNEKRKKDQESTDKARKQGLLACGSWAACEESVESNPPQVRSRAPLGARSGDSDLPGFPLKRRSRSKS